MALVAVTGGIKGVFAIMAITAGFPLHHGSHAIMLGTVPEREDLGMAVVTFVHTQVDFVAEQCRFKCAVGQDKCHRTRYITGVAFNTITCHRESVLTVMTGTTSFAGFHGNHGNLQRCLLEREDFGMTDVAFVIHSQVDLVAEDRRSCLFTGYGEGNFFWVHPFVAFAAVSGYGKSSFAIMTYAALFPLFHLDHGDISLTGDDGLAIVTTPALAAGFGDVKGVAECCILDPFGFKDNITWFTFVAANAGFFITYTESFDAGMTGSASFGLFHLLHRVVLLLADIEDCVVTHLAVAVDVPLLQVKVVTEYDLIGILEVEFNVLRLGSEAGVCSREGDENRQGRKQKLHNGLLQQRSNPKPGYNTVNLLIRQLETYTYC